MTTIDAIKNEVTNWSNEEAKHTAGNKSAGTRARKALSEIMKLAKQRRVEIQDEKDKAEEAAK